MTEPTEDFPRSGQPDSMSGQAGRAAANPARDPVMANPMRPVFEHGTLAALLERRTREALASGALLPIPTEAEWVHEAAGTFALRVVSRLADKEAERCRQAGLDDPARGGRQGAGDTGGRPNPFLPYEEALYVADVSESHVALLNKFNVLERHLLLVTRRFEHQETLLNARDFEALGRCLRELDGLGFYNGGEMAGASQPHKHLQLVPLPLAPGGPEVPLQEAILSSGLPDTPGRSARLPFRHALVSAGADWTSNPATAAAQMVSRYRALIEACGLEVRSGPHGETVAPYNLLATRRYLLLVPRSAECFAGVSLNALAFAGALLVRSRAQRDALVAAGCMQALRGVAFPPFGPS